MSEIINKPQLTILDQGSEFKVYGVTGKAGMSMPEHISTQEAVVFVKKGEGILHIDGKDQDLKKGTTTIIPGSVVHSLDLTSDFEAVITMALESRIQFSH